MAAISFPPNDTPSTARTLYTSNPWTDPSGNQWLWSAAKERWSPISETVENAVTDNNTNAVSSNAVFDALALKAPLSGATFTGPITATAITATAITGTTGTFSGNISPTVTNTQSFGSSGLNWNTIWARNVRTGSGTLILDDGNAAITITSGTLALGNRKLTALRGLEFQTDNTYDIGATSTTLRPRDLFLARNAGIGGNLTATGTVTAGGTNTWTGSTFSGAQAFSGDVSVTGNTTVAAATETAVALGTVATTATIAITAGTLITATLTESTACTFTMPTASAGKSFTLLLKQEATTGNGTATFTAVKWPAGTAPTITATAGQMDLLTFVSDGTNWYGSAAQNFTP